MTFYGQYTVPDAKTCVNFGVGQPSKRFLPLNLIREGANKLFDEEDVDLLQYGDIPGFLNFRENLSKFLNNNFKELFNKYDIDQEIIDPEDLFTTNGVTQGLSLLCSLFLKSGDTIFEKDPKLITFSDKRDKDGGGGSSKYNN